MSKTKIGRPNGSSNNVEGLRRFRDTSADLLREYYASGKSTGDIGRLFGVSRTAVDNRFISLGIARRNQGEVNTVNNSKLSVPLTPLQRQMLLGSILGDACLHEYDYGGSGRRGMKVCFAQGVAQLEYLKHKRSIILEGRQTLPRTCVSKIGQRPEGSNIGLPMWQFAFSHSPTLLHFCDEFDMKDANRVTHVSDKWIEALDAVSVAYWFLDDGSILSYPVDGAWRFTLHTDAYDEDELTRLLSFVRKFCAPRAHFIRKREGQFAIQSDYKDEVHALVRLIAPHVPECMLHKLKKIT